MRQLPREAWLPEVRRRRLSLERQGIELALLDWGGEGPLALLHHANGFCAGVWGLVAEKLRDRFRVIAYDARGHGDSERPQGPAAYAWERFAEDVEEVAERLAEETGAEGAIGVGHSFGGTAMLGAAARRPGLFRRLVLVDPVVPPPPAAAALDPERRRRVGGLVEGARRRTQVFASRAEAHARWSGRSMFARWDPRALDLYLAHGLRERSDGRVELKCPAAVEAAIFDAGPFDVHAVGRRVTAPTLLLWARRGDFPRAIFERMVAALPHARIEEVDSGHLIPMERPDAVAQAVVGFAAEALADGRQSSTG